MAERETVINRYAEFRRKFLLDRRHLRRLAALQEMSEYHRLSSREKAFVQQELQIVPDLFRATARDCLWPVC